jgi:hypothetical protein
MSVASTSEAVRNGVEAHDVSRNGGSCRDSRFRLWLGNVIETHLLLKSWFVLTGNIRTCRTIERGRYGWQY